MSQLNSVTRRRLYQLPQQFWSSLNRRETAFVALCMAVILQAAVHTLWMSHTQEDLLNQIESQQSAQSLALQRNQSQTQSASEAQRQWIQSLPPIGSSTEVLIAIENAAATLNVSVLSTRMTEAGASTSNRPGNPQSKVQVVVVRYSIRSDYNSFLDFISSIQNQSSAISMTELSMSRIEGTSNQLDILCSLAIQFNTENAPSQFEVEPWETPKKILKTISERVDIFNPNQSNHENPGVEIQPPPIAITQPTEVQASTLEALAITPQEPTFRYTPIALLEKAGLLTIYLQLDQKTVAVQSEDQFENGTYRVEMLTNEVLQVRNIPLDYLHEIKLEKLGYP